MTQWSNACVWTNKNGQYNYLLLTIIIKYRYTFRRLVLYVSLIEFDSDGFTDEDGTMY